jgi:hypothetical protein
LGEGKEMAASRIHKVETRAVGYKPKSRKPKVESRKPKSRKPKVKSQKAESRK